MKKTITKLLALALAVLMTLSLAACGKKDSGAADDKVELPVADGAVIGQGATAITVQVTGADGKTVTFTVNTDEETVGAALLALGDKGQGHIGVGLTLGQLQHDAEGVAPFGGYQHGNTSLTMINIV